MSRCMVGQSVDQHRGGETQGLVRLAIIRSPDVVHSGTTLGPYEILAPIGKGGMGEVYRARDTRLDRDVAIKVSTANSRSAFRARPDRCRAESLERLSSL